MLSSFFNRKDGKQPEMKGKESVTGAGDVLNEDQEAAGTDEEVFTELSIHPAWKVPKEDLYSFQFLNQECPPLKPNQLSLYGVNVTVGHSENRQFTAFIRHSLNKGIKLEEATIVLTDEDDQVLGRKTFDLSGVGEIPPRSSRPWTFEFTDKDLFTEEIPESGWKLAFQLKPSAKKHSIDFADSWTRSLATEDKEKLTEMVNKMTPPKPGEVNFLGLQAKFAKDSGDLHVTILIRNGGEKNINLEQIPLQIEDAEGDIIAKGGFKMDPKLLVKSHTSKPWNFVFPKSMMTKENPDLSKWKAYPPQKSN